MKLALVLVLLLGAQVAQAQSPKDMEDAKVAFNQGQTAYDLANYDEALKHFTRAYELSKLPAILFNLGQAERRLYETGGALDHLRRSRELYRSYLRLVPINPNQALTEDLLKQVEEEYKKQLHAQRDKLLVEAKGEGALNLAEDFLAQDDRQAAATALDRFVKTPGAKRADVARGLRVKARLAAANGDPVGAVDAFRRALSLDPGLAPPPEREAAAASAYRQARDKMKGIAALKLEHAPPARLKIGAIPRLRFGVANDVLGMVQGLEVSYRADQSAYARMSAKPGEVTFPPEFSASLAPGTRVEYWVNAVDAEGAALDTLGSAAEPFVLKVDEKPAKPVHKRWQFWVGLGAGVLVAAGAATAIGVTQAPPERVAIPVFTGLGAGR
jgi:tetratricopeptide (TPR) repeat protein